MSSLVSPLRCNARIFHFKAKEEIIPVGCVPAARRPYVFSSQPPDVSTSKGDPKVNKFEHVPGLGHQMLLAGALYRDERGRALYNEVQCIMGNSLKVSSHYVDRMMSRHDRKHYLPATSLAGGKYG